MSMNWTTNRKVFQFEGEFVVAKFPEDAARFLNEAGMDRVTADKMKLREPSDTLTVLFESFSEVPKSLSKFRCRRVRHSGYALETTMDHWAAAYPEGLLCGEDWLGEPWA